MIGHKTKIQSIDESRRRRLQAGRRYAALVKMQSLDTAQIAELHQAAIFLVRDDETVKADRAAAMKMLDSVSGEDSNVV